MSGQPALMARRRFCSNPCRGAWASGPNAPSWRGGITKVRQAIDNTPEYKAWRIAVRTRDRGRCRECDAQGVRRYGRLETHHIIPVSARPDLATTVSNGITLCRPHHVVLNGRECEAAPRLAALIGAPLLASPAPNRKDRAPFTMTAEQLRSEYVTAGRTTQEIGTAHGVTGTCVGNYLRRYGIPARSPSESRSLRRARAA